MWYDPAMYVEHVSSTEALCRLYSHDTSLANLIFSGYDFKESTRREGVVNVARYEYEFPEDRTDVFIAYDGADSVGSLTLLTWIDDAEDERGLRFYNQLRQTDPLMLTRLGQCKRPVTEVAGIVVDKHYRRLGIASFLLGVARHCLNPAIIEGQTKNPAVVALRAKLPEYRTFYGGTEVTPDQPCPQVNAHLSLHQAFRAAWEIQPRTDGELVHEFASALSPAIPEVMAYPTIVRLAFDPVIKAQREIGFAGKTIMAFLLSIASEILTTD